MKMLPNLSVTTVGSVMPSSSHMSRKPKDVEKSQVGAYTMWKLGDWRIMKMPGTSEPYILSSWRIGTHITMTLFLKSDTPELVICAILQRINGSEFYTSFDSILKPFYIERWPK